MTYVIEVPRIFDERSFDQFAAGFAGSEGASDEVRVCVDQRQCSQPFLDGEAGIRRRHIGYPSFLDAGKPPAVATMTSVPEARNASRISGSARSSVTSVETASGGATL